MSSLDYLDVVGVEYAEDTYAKKSGEYPNLTAGTAEGLIGQTYEVDQSAYNYRKSHAGGRVREQIVGGTVAWNQLEMGDAENWVGNNSACSVSIADGVYTFTITNNSSVYKNKRFKCVTPGHRYYVAFKGKSSSADRAFKIGFRTDAASSTAYNFLQIPAGQSDYADFRAIATPEGGQTCISIGTTSATPLNEYCNLKDFVIIDLTAMFASTIADYIYSLEQSSAGAGVAWLGQYIDLDTYHAYNAGSLESVQTEGREVLDENDAVIATYPVSNVELRGIPKLVDNQLAFDGDVYAADGTIKRRIVLKTLNGTEEWAKTGAASGQTSFFRYKVGEINTVPASDAILSDKYITIPDLAVGNAYVGIRLINSTGYNGSFIYIRPDGDINNMTADDFKALLAANPVTCVYLVVEREETTETADPYVPVQAVGDTERWIDNRAVPVPVGQNSKYYPDYAEKIDRLPSDFSTLIAPTEETYTATRNYASGDYLIVNNQLYFATTAIANGGSITPGTNVSATTIMDIIREILDAI